jgi:hypothetical protein
VSVVTARFAPRPECVRIGANNIVQISVSSGSAIINGSTTDNTTNDPAIQVMTVAFAIA